MIGTLLVDGCLWSLLYCTQTYAEPVSDLPPQWNQRRSGINGRNGFVNDDTGSRTSIDPRYRGMGCNAKDAKAMLDAHGYIQRYNADPNAPACDSYWGHQGRKVAWRCGWRSFYVVTIILILGCVILAFGLGMSVATLRGLWARNAPATAFAMGFLSFVAVGLVCFILIYVGRAVYNYLRKLRASS